MEVKEQPRNLQSQSFWLRHKLSLLRMPLSLMQRIRHLDPSMRWTAQLTQLSITTSFRPEAISKCWIPDSMSRMRIHVFFLEIVSKNLCLSFPLHELMASWIAMLFGHMYINEFLVARKAMICHSHIRNYGSN